MSAPPSLTSVRERLCTRLSDKLNTDVGNAGLDNAVLPGFQEAMATRLKQENAREYLMPSDGKIIDSRAAAAVADLFAKLLARPISSSDLRATVVGGGTTAAWDAICNTVIMRQHDIVLVPCPTYGLFTYPIQRAKGTAWPVPIHDGKLTAAQVSDHIRQANRASMERWYLTAAPSLEVFLRALSLERSFDVEAAIAAAQRVVATVQANPKERHNPRTVAQKLFAEVFIPCVFGVDEDEEAMVAAWAELSTNSLLFNALPGRFVCLYLVNPTISGLYYTSQELEDLLSVVAANHGTLVEDLAYTLIPLQTDPTAATAVSLAGLTDVVSLSSFGQRSRADVITLLGVSKSFGIADARIGCVLAPPPRPRQHGRTLFDNVCSAMLVSMGPPSATSARAFLDCLADTDRVLQFLRQQSTVSTLETMQPTVSSYAFKLQVALLCVRGSTESTNSATEYVTQALLRHFPHAGDHVTAFLRDGLSAWLRLETVPQGGFFMLLHCVEAVLLNRTMFLPDHGSPRQSVRFASAFEVSLFLAATMGIRCIPQEAMTVDPPRGQRAAAGHLLRFSFSIPSEDFALAAFAMYCLFHSLTPSAEATSPSTPATKQHHASIAVAATRPVTKLEHANFVEHLRHSTSAKSPYTIAGGLRVTVPGFSVDVLRRAIARVVERHDVLRSAFVVDGGGVTCNVLTGVPATLHVLGPQTPSSTIAELFESPFDLSSGQLSRFVCVEHTDGHHELFLVQHHIVSDTFSINNILREVCTEYELIDALPSGATLPPVETIRAYGFDEDETDVAWHTAQLDGRRVLLPPEGLAKNHAPPADIDLTLAVPSSLRAHVRAQVATFGGTEYTYWLALLCQCCHDVYSEGVTCVGAADTAGPQKGLLDVTVAVPHGGREHAGSHSGVGLYANTLWVRVKTETVADPEANAKAVAKAARNALADARDHSQAAYGSVWQRVAKTKGELLPVMLSFTPPTVSGEQHWQPTQCPASVVRWDGTLCNTHHTPLMVRVNAVDDAEYRLTLSVNSRHVPQGHAEALERALVAALWGIAGAAAPAVCPTIPPIASTRTPSLPQTTASTAQSMTFDHVARTVQDAAQAVLKLDAPPHVDDSLGDLGMQSLHMMMLVTHCHKRLGTTADAGEFSNLDTVRSIAERLIE